MQRIISAAPLLALAAFCGSPAFGQTATATDPATLETVVVTGTEAQIATARTELALIPGGTTLIDIDDLGERNVASLADALRYVPGVWSVSDTGNDNIFFSSRGSNLDATDYDMNGIKLLQDGLPVTAADGNNHNRVIDPLAARYATLARGANALSYGASTLGGAVNFVTPTASDNAGIEAALTTGSHGQALGRLSIGRRFGTAGDGLVTIEGKRWDGYRDHNEQTRNGLYANAGWQLTNGWSTRIYLTVIDNDQELAGSLTRAQLDADPDQANPTAVIGNYQVNVDTTRLATRTTWQIDADRRLDFGFSIEEQSLFHPIVVAPFFTLLIDTDHRDTGSMVRYSHRLGAHDLLLGLNYGENGVDGGNYGNLGGRPKGLQALIDDRASTTEVFALDRWQVTDATTLVLAAQAVSARREVRNTAVPSGTLRNPAASYDRINPRIGIVHSLGSQAALYANVSRLYEPPTNFQLEDNVAGGSATLRPMQGSVVEVGFRGSRGDRSAMTWNWDVAVYRADIDDEILSVEDPSAPGTSLVTNVDRTIHAGLEAVFGATLRAGRAGARLEPLVTLTLNDFGFDTDTVYGNNELPAAPRYFVRGELIYRSAGGFFVGPTVERVGRRWADFANGYRIDPHTLLGLRAGAARGRWRAYADLRNVTDEVYVVSHSVRNVASAGDAILNSGEPLSVYVGFEIGLN